ncbi:hypothetical protein HS088_TW13G00856 [Tripterygium wilfordii]|uniref:Uncharacterized protein n=1 Tax=Tripterygium wilfordii TaxID=458696 RepID=A0A7J7CV73_TRIWF|nr:hypothetical protein HS088_TW13G00856 [Tripterygium wilfordii]
MHIWLKMELQLDSFLLYAKVLKSLGNGVCTDRDNALSWMVGFLLFSSNQLMVLYMHICNPDHFEVTLIHVIQAGHATAAIATCLICLVVIYVNSYKKGSGFALSLLN